MSGDSDPSPPAEKKRKTGKKSKRSDEGFDWTIVTSKLPVLIVGGLALFVAVGQQGAEPGLAPTPTPVPPATTTTGAPPPRQRTKAKEAETGKAWDIEASSDLLSELVELAEQVEKAEQMPEGEKTVVLDRVAKELLRINVTLGDAQDENTKQRRALLQVVYDAVKGQEPDFSSITTYANADYWDDAYKSDKYGEHFEWFMGFSTASMDGVTIQGSLEAALGKLKVDLPGKPSALTLGCGNSMLGVDMAKQDWFDKVVNTDISKAAMDRMREKHSGHIFEVEDATNLTYGDDSFSVIVEKGLLDTFEAGQAFDGVEKTVNEICRVTSSGGILLSISHGEPNGRQATFKECFACDPFVEWREQKSEQRVEKGGKRTYIHTCVRI